MMEICTRYVLIYVCFLFLLFFNKNEVSIEIIIYLLDLNEIA